MSSSTKSRSGKVAKLFEQILGTLIEGDGITALADNTWFKINARASSGSTLPDFPLGALFKSPDSGNAITPIAGDDVYPITLEQICKGDVTNSAENETVDVTDDCGNGYNKNIYAGFTTVSGNISAFFKYVNPGDDLPSAQERFLNKFYDIASDDGEGGYTYSAKEDVEVLIAILKNSDNVTVGDTQIWQMTPAVLTGLTADNPLKGAQNFDIAFTKGEDPAQFYKRTTNSEETVF